MAKAIFYFWRQNWRKSGADNRIITLLKNRDGLTDREITDALLGKNKPQQAVNKACNALADRGALKRVIRKENLRMKQEIEILKKAMAIFAKK